MPVSAKTGENVDQLFTVLAGRLPEGDAAYPDDFLTATPETVWIGEVIREKLLERTRDELPFAHAVVIESVRPERTRTSRSSSRPSSSSARARRGSSSERAGR